MGKIILNGKPYSNGTDLDSLSDVNISNLKDNQLLRWDELHKQWVNSDEDSGDTVKLPRYVVKRSDYSGSRTLTETMTYLGIASGSAVFSVEAYFYASEDYDGYVVSWGTNNTRQAFGMSLNHVITWSDDHAISGIHTGLHHRVITYDGNVTVKVYEDNVLLNTFTLGGSLNIGNANVYWGKWIQNSWNFSGTIYYCKYYDKILTEDEIALLYANRENETAIIIKSDSKKFVGKWTYYRGSSDQYSLEDGWAGPFKSANYYLSPFDDSGASLKVDFTKPWEVDVVFKNIQNDGRTAVLFGSDGSGVFYSTPTVEINSSTRKLWWGYSTNGTSWTNSNVLDYVIQVGKEYLLKCIWDGRNYSLFLIEEGTLVKYHTEILATAHYSGTTYSFEFGGIAKSSNHYASNVLINYQRTKIISNGRTLLGMTSDSETEIPAPVFMDGTRYFFTSSGMRYDTSGKSWFKSGTYPVSVEIYYYGSTTSDGYLFCFGTGSDKQSFSISQTRFVSIFGQDWTFASDDGNGLHHIVVTYDGNVTVKAYRDGVLMGIHTLSSALSIVDSRIVFGGWVGNESLETFKGTFYYVKVYDKELNYKEITTLYEHRGH